jgi:hypothetical protein
MSGVPTSLAETAVALAVFYLLYRAFLRHDTHFHLSRLYLAGSLVLAFALPLVDLPSPFRTVGPSSVSLGPVDPALIPADGVDWAAVATGLYLMGAGAMLIRLGWHLWQLGRLSNREPVVLADGLRVVYLDDDGPPFSFMRTVFVHCPEQADESAMAQVVAHERAHIRQGHSIDVLLVHLALVFQWFNPVVWAYRSALTDVHEFLADREVLRHGHERSTYARLLLAQHLGASPLELAHQFRHSQIRRRLDMMTRHSGRWTIAKYLLVVPALAILVVAYGEPRIVAADDTAVIGAQTTAAPAQQPAAGAQTTSQKTATPAEKELAEKKAAEMKAAEAELNEKLKALEKKYNSTDDPALKKEIELKMKQLRESNGNGGNTLKVNLNDPAALADVIAKISQKIEMLEAKRASTTDAELLAKISQDVDSLKMKRKELKTALAELKDGKQK